MPTAAEIRAAATKARNAAKAALIAADLQLAEARRIEHQEQRAKEAAENAAHYTNMQTQIGQGEFGLNDAQHAIVYSQAWEDGHSSGYSEVENYYRTYAEMARRILNTN